MFVRFLILIAIVVGALTLNICIGDVNIAPAAALASVFSPGSSATGAEQAGIMEIIWQVRLPRLLVAAAVGAALSVSGYLLQSLSRNQLADPYLTGVSSGAGVTAALAISLGMSFQIIPLAAFVGGLTASTIVATLSRSPTGLSVTRLLLAGVALSTICGGLITLIITMGGDPVRAQGIFFWLAGGISGRTWDELAPTAFYTTAGIIAALAMSKQIRLLSVGTQQAMALGVDVARAQWTLLFLAVLMCGAAVSVSGLVGFVGLVAPHVTRRLFGRDERAHILCSALVGMVLVLLSDLAARTLVSGQELPLGTLMSLIGGPFFLWLVSREKGEQW